MKLPKALRNELIQYIDTEWTMTQSAWNPWLENSGRWYRAYDNDLDNKTDPWPGCSNLHIPATSIAVERMHSSLLALVANPKKIVTAVPTEESDIRLAAKVTKYANHVMSGQMKFPAKYDLTAHRTCIIGQVGCVVYWSDRRRISRVNHRAPKNQVGSGNAQDVARFHFGDAILSLEARDGSTVDVEYTEKSRSRDAVLQVMKDVDRIDPRDDEIEYEVRSWTQVEYGPVVDPTMPEDLLYTTDSTLPEDASIHFYTQWLRLQHIEGLIHRGEWQLDKKILKMLRDDQKKQATADSNPTREGLRTSSEANSPVKTTSAIRRHRFQTQKVFCAYDIDGDGYPEELIISLLYDKTNTPHILAIEDLDSVVPIGERPVAFSQFVPYDNAPAAKGIPELLSPVQSELNTIHNQRVDRDAVITLPFFMYGRGAGLATQLYKLRPGEGVPVGDVTQIRFPTFPQSTGSDFNTELQLQGYAEKMIPSSDLQLGRATPGRQTAYETASLIQQGDAQFGKFIGRQGGFIGRVATLAVSLASHFMDPEYEFRAMGDKEITNLKREDVHGYDFSTYSTANVINAGANAQQTITLFTVLSQSPLVAQREGRLWWLHKALLESLQRPDIEQLIGPEPEDSFHPPMNPDKEHILFNQGIYRDARLDDDHERHMAEHQQRLGEASFKGNQDEVKMLSRHLESHSRLFSQAQQAALQQQGGEISVRDNTPGGGGTDNQQNSQAAVADQQFAQAGAGGL